MALCSCECVCFCVCVGVEGGSVRVGVFKGVVGWILQLKPIKSPSEEFFTESHDGLTVPKCSHNSCSCAVLSNKFHGEKKKDNG